MFWKPYYLPRGDPLPVSGTMAWTLEQPDGIMRGCVHYESLTRLCDNVTYRRCEISHTLNYDP
jgi:hypothetical protein